MGAVDGETVRSHWLETTALTSLVALIPGLAFAQVITDGSTGPGGALSGPDYQITEDLGTRAGDNLFHSFSDFSIGTGESATFSGPDEIENVISRVTGPNPSDIDGTLRSTMPGADFYFINPNGVTFGPNASLDVQGSFHVSTADEIRFEGGDVFSATNADASGFSVAEPRAFGFFDADPGAILLDGSTLEVDEGETLSLVGGDITVDGRNDGLFNGQEQGLVQATGGQVLLTAAGEAGEVDIDTGVFSEQSLSNVILTNQAAINTRGDGGGSIRIESGALDVEGLSILDASNTGLADSIGGIIIDSDDLTVSDLGIIIADATNLLGGSAGFIAISANSVSIDDGGSFPA